MVFRRFAVVTLFLLTALFGLSGCAEEPKIATHFVPRLNSTQRFVGAIAFPVPEGGKNEEVWFFKILADEMQVSNQKDAVFAFLKSVRFDAKGKPVWKLPENWTENKDKEERFATILIPGNPKKLEMSVLPLPRGHTIDETLLQNINRWRHQLGLHGVGSEKDYFLEEARLGNAEAYLVDMVGPGAPQAVAAQRPPPAKNPFRFTRPTGWKQTQPMPPSQLSFLVLEDGKRAEFTLTALPGDAGGFVPNVRRWAEDQLKMPKREAAEYERLARDITVAERDSKYVDLTGPNPDLPRGDRILGVIVARENRTWFFKLMGPANLVGRHKDSFEKFVKSFAFAD